MSWLKKAFLNPAEKAVTGAIGKLGTVNDTKSVVTIGIRGSGKTAVLGCIELCADLKSQRVPNFSHMLRERSSGMRQVPCDLARGRFPAATPPGIIYEADEIMRWKYPFGERKVVMSFCETAGEDIQNIAGRFTDSVYEQNTDWQNAETLNRYICNANGYLMMLPVSLTDIPGMPKIESPPEGLHADPDLSAARILSQIYGFKQDSGSPPIDGIGVIFTKYDLVEPYCKANGMNLYTHEGAQKFMETFFRQTSAVLKYYNEDNSLDKVKFFPFHIQVKRKDLGNGESELMRGPNGYEIARDPRRNLPVFSEQSGYDIIDWIGDTFAR